MSPSVDGDRSPREGRDRLLDTAEVLFDRHGIDGVSARAITQAAGHRNNAAVNYYFGTRSELVEAVLTRHLDGTDAERHRLLDELEAQGSPSMAAVVDAVYRPLVDLLDEPSGRRYLRLLGQAAAHPGYTSRTDLRLAGSIRRAGRLVLPSLPHLRGARLEQRMHTLVAMSLATLCQQAWLRDEADPPRTPLTSEALQVELVTTAMGLLQA